MLESMCFVHKKKQFQVNFKMKLFDLAFSPIMPHWGSSYQLITNQKWILHWTNGLASALEARQWRGYWHYTFSTKYKYCMCEQFKWYTASVQDLSLSIYAIKITKWSKLKLMYWMSTYNPPNPCLTAIYFTLWEKIISGDVSKKKMWQNV